MKILHYKKVLSTALLLSFTLGAVTEAAASNWSRHSWTKVITQESPETGEPTDNARVKGAYSKITRTEEEICTYTPTRDLPPGAYTNWWVVFNSPENCTGDGALSNAKCSLSTDRWDPVTNASAFRVANGVVGPRGKTIFDSCISVNGEYEQLLHGEGLTNPNAEIYLIIKWHGPAVNDDSFTLGEQLSKVGGNCETFIGQDYLGRSHCPNPQVAIHRSSRK